MNVLTEEPECVCGPLLTIMATSGRVGKFITCTGNNFVYTIIIMLLVSSKGQTQC